MDGGFYICFRFAVATVLITWLACEIPFELRQLGPEKPILLSFTYATEWAFILYTFTAIAFAAFCIYYRLNKDRANKEDMIGNKVLWFFFNLAANSILTTSGIYWIGFWDRDYGRDVECLFIILESLIPLLLKRSFEEPSTEIDINIEDNILISGVSTAPAFYKVKNLSASQFTAFI
ncbi:hypothetical protein ACTXT7_017366 [Hymenolepis weldensis]